MSGPKSDPAFLPALHGWFTRPPRRHGEVDTERTVSFLELFYDLVFVVLVGQIAHTLAGNVTWEGVYDFAVIFGLVWIAWFNGSMYHEMHGREDGRGRMYFFAQMFVLVVMAVFAGQAAGEDGRPFAISLVILLLLLIWQWNVVRRDDAPEYRRTTTRYILGLVAATSLIVASIFADDTIRMALWAAMVVGWVLSVVVQFLSSPTLTAAETPTESMAERFGLLTIIVLGEMVVGVVEGIIEAEPDALTIITGLLAMNIGFGFWWNYFDSVGRRLPRLTRGNVITWMVVHLPLAGAIAAAGAGMVSLIEHSEDLHTPAATAWLLAGASAALLVCLAVLVRSVQYQPSFQQILPQVTRYILIGVVASLALGLWAPKPWLFALGLTLVHSAIWMAVFATRVKHSALPAEPEADGSL